VSTFLAATAAIAEDVKRISANGTDVEMGKGDPVIFVHGGLQDDEMWASHLPKFADRYRAMAYSRRNNFPNESSPEGMPDGAADAHAEDLAGLARALGPSKVRVVAHSSGAHLFFAAYPEMVTSLALNEPPASNSSLVI
jgi:non-heme chloroperoxidase